MKNRQTSFVRRHPLITLITLALLASTAAACDLLGGNTSCNDNPATAWRATLPPSAADVQERCSYGIINPDYTVTFNMSPADLETFQQSTSITDWQSDASSASRFAAEAARAKSLLVGNYGDGAVSLEVLIDTSDPQQYRVSYYAAFVD